VSKDPSRLAINLRSAVAAERSVLEELQWRASLENSSYRAALEANPDAIELPASQIENGGVFVAERDDVVVGFAAILPRPDGDAELDALFVEPSLWHRGIGRALVDHCCLEAKAIGAASLHVVGNPQAQKFYHSCGFIELGVQATRFGQGLLMKRSV
jgi:GNAT superfamily N-acetyltransferase